ncbi:uncharacterized protein PHALS_03524 [Plasmopara halstedii]|uniref:Uncharacterized protein n=1 Tax=Plasmopara halstedii TaxID=4781 RepID=A0A0P1AWP3_PLAHL|nr:uncharacterized protein PHALS_03524 [Plasmopara halstedii]CEG46847.1 hypothetical protein PHALS_03524 [Plasmopara halstedii]|eukprot:XP_024583216.1 hypothetical protein PHALS_03524 [Plasmopara halstedii]
MYGSDVDINVEYVKTDWPITIYKTNGQIEGECKKVALPTLVTSIGKSLLVGQPLPVSHKRKMKTAIEILLPASCTCKSKPRPCVFISGIGSLVEKEKNQDSFSYWGKITGHTPCCSSTKYAVLNTTKVFWTDAQLQQKVCDHILIESATSEGSIISDTIIFSYSMGGLLLAGAIANGRCSLNKSSTWVSTGTPIYGTMGSDYLQDVCVNKTTLVVEKLANFAELCPPKEGIKSMAYVNGTYSNNKLKMAYKAAQKAYVDNVYALMCSHSFSGVLSRYQAAFWVLGRIIPHKSRESDGAVEFSSCAGGFPASNFGNDFRDRFYSSRLNHYDLAFRAGDALLDRTKMPMKWFECLL